MEVWSCTLVVHSYSSFQGKLQWCGNKNSFDIDLLHVRLRILYIITIWILRNIYHILDMILVAVLPLVAGDDPEEHGSYFV